jgi:hypothetical protein
MRRRCSEATHRTCGDIEEIKKKGSNIFWIKEAANNSVFIYEVKLILKNAVAWKCDTPHLWRLWGDQEKLWGDQEKKF